MAEFQAKVYALKIEEHPNADALEVARVGDYRSIVRKGQYKTGDLGVYIPEQAICPLWLIRELGLEGRLAGKAQNRVKAIKLRGVLSQGLIYPVVPEDDKYNTHIVIKDDKGVANRDRIGRLVGVEEGDDVTEELGITKYEPIIPASMSGEVHGAAGCTLKYDIENIKKYPDVLEDGEMVMITEKLHGTWCCFGYHPDHGPIVTSKGLSARGLVFKLSVKNELQNLYVRTLDSTVEQDFNSRNIIERAAWYLQMNYLNREIGLPKETPFYILGEIFGRGVQDLHYGQEKPAFRIFDVYVGNPGQGHYLGYDDLIDFANDDEIATPLVPVLYVGDYSKEIVDHYTDGKDSIGGFNIREGVVVKPCEERSHDELGRVVLKSVSEDYLLRKGGTEYN
jgi:RNA ligase (TIGR02306 family)